MSSAEDAGYDYSPTALQILNVTESLVQERGFNRVSYADIAAELGITKPALHYHFNAKADLGLALLERQRTVFGELFDELEARHAPAPETLSAYTDVFATVLDQGRLCLCGMLAAEYVTLPAAMRDAVLAFFADNEAWLATLLERGRSEGTFTFDGTPQEIAGFILSSVEGAMLVARAQGDTGRFRTAVAGLLRALTR